MPASSTSCCPCIQALSSSFDAFVRSHRVRDCLARELAHVVGQGHLTLHEDDAHADKNTILDAARFFSDAVANGLQIEQAVVSPSIASGTLTEAQRAALPLFGLLEQDDGSPVLWHQRLQ
ncbi:hypothetical protein EON68_00130, partial [archaeon]